MDKLSFIEVASDIGAGERGASLGIPAIQLQAFKNGSHLFKDVKSVVCPVTNDSLKNHVTPRNEARWIEEVAANCEQVVSSVCDELRQGQFPLVLAGDHSTAAGTIAGIKKHIGNKKLGVIWIDAHADIHSPYTTPSGNVHGMPLGASMAADNQQVAKNQPHPDTLAAWSRMKSMSGHTPCINPEDLVYIGVRDTERQEDQIIDRMGIKRISVGELNHGGVLWGVEETKAHLDQCDVIYISFDVDSMDPAYSEGTGTPVPDGLTPYQAESLVSAFLEWEKTVALELVEVNPLLDSSNQMAKWALNLLTDWHEVLKTRL